MKKLRLLSILLISLGVLLMLAGGGGLLGGIGDGDKAGVMLAGGVALVLASTPLYLASR